MTTVCIMQPTYLGWLGYFDMLDQADVFVLLDTVAVSPKSWQTRNRIRARDGNVVWLSVPTHARQGQALNAVRIADRPWRAKHRRTIEAAYGHAPHFDCLRVPLEEICREDRVALTALNFATMIELASWGNMATPRIEFASSLGVTATDPIARIRGICEATEATGLLNTPGARGFLEGHDIGVPIRWHDYEHPVYTQGDAPFVSHLSIVDLLAWHGPDSLAIIRSGRR